MRGLIVVFILAGTVLGVPFFSNAQTAANQLALELSPEFPQPQEEFSVTLNSYGLNRASVQWFINGNEKTLSKNENAITLEAGELGSPTNITARVTLQNGAVLDTKHTVIPHRVDLVITADTVTPALYSGRKLPSSGSVVNATALVFTSGGLSNNYSYLWKLNNATQNGGALRGKNTFSFTPGFENASTLSVDVLNSRGQVIARKTEVIPIAKPEIKFYEMNPLRGRSLVAMANPYIFVGDEVTFRAEGYFMGKDLASANVLHEWKIDGRNVENGEKPNEITIQKNGGGGKIPVSYHIRNLKQLLQGARESITIQF